MAQKQSNQVFVTKDGKRKFVARDEVQAAAAKKQGLVPEKAEEKKAK